MRSNDTHLATMQSGTLQPAAMIGVVALLHAVLLQPEEVAALLLQKVPNLLLQELLESLLLLQIEVLPLLREPL